MPKNTSCKTYEKAIEELETIVANLEKGDLEIDKLSDQVKEAKQLIALCREKLTKVEADIQQIFEDGKE